MVQLVKSTHDASLLLVSSQSQERAVTVRWEAFSFSETKVLKAKLVINWRGQRIKRHFSKNFSWMFLKQSHQQVSRYFFGGRGSPLHLMSSIILAGWGGRNRTFETASLSNGPFTGTDSKWCMHFKIPIQSNKYALRVLSPCNTCFQQNTVLLTGGEELPGVPVHHLGLHQHVRRVSRCTDQPLLLRLSF